MGYFITGYHRIMAGYTIKFDRIIVVRKKCRGNHLAEEKATVSVTSLTSHLKNPYSSPRFGEENWK
jgi:hypothetical protein